MTFVWGFYFGEKVMSKTWLEGVSTISEREELLQSLCTVNECAEGLFKLKNELKDELPAFAEDHREVLNEAMVFDEAMSRLIDAGLELKRQIDGSEGRGLEAARWLVRGALDTASLFVEMACEQIQHEVERVRAIN